jgi:hypothetical protein
MSDRNTRQLAREFVALDVVAPSRVTAVSAADARADPANRAGKDERREVPRPDAPRSTNQGWRILGRVGSVPRSTARRVGAGRGLGVVHRPAQRPHEMQNCTCAGLLPIETLRGFDSRRLHISLRMGNRSHQRLFYPSECVYVLSPDAA